MARPEDFRDKRIKYNLRTLIPILEKSGLVDEARKKLIASRAQKAQLPAESEQGLDFLQRLGLRVTRDNREMILDEELILRTLAEHFGLEFKKVDPVETDIEISTQTISESFARKNVLVPIKAVEGELHVLVFNPFRPELWEDMHRVTDLPCRIFLGTRKDILRLIDDFYQFKLSIRAAEREFASSNNLGDQESRVEVADKTDASSQKHIIKAVDYLLRSAIRERASDIHLEPKRKSALVKYRIDGILHTMYRIPQIVHQAILSRLKGMSRMDIAEKRRPQDGRVQLVLEEIPTDVRISTVPIAFGEKMVMRLLSSESTLKPLEELGMNKTQQKTYQNFLDQPYGLLLVTGPTGSGKSTTLYSTLKRLADPRLNIITLEDPIEMVVDEFNQIGIQSRIGVTFPSMLRHILRQDPDIIMIGEMRDLETAEQAIQSALTGHLVLSTLHTNDAPSVFPRLQEMGVENYLINSALIGAVAQRLVRTICPHCRVRREITKKDKLNWGLQEELKGTDFLWEGEGCPECRKTGYLGRSALFEIISFDPELKEAVRNRAELWEFQNIARSKGIKGLFQDGLDKVKQGSTTVNEVLRVAGHAE
ncbi:MAG: GspE/PulE family protein [Desulfonatronovibrionaceae bacterium]